MLLCSPKARIIHPLEQYHKMVGKYLILESSHKSLIKRGYKGIYAQKSRFCLCKNIHRKSQSTQRISLVQRILATLVTWKRPCCTAHIYSPSALNLYVSINVPPFAETNRGVTFLLSLQTEKMFSLYCEEVILEPSKVIYTL